MKRSLLWISALVVVVAVGATVFWISRKPNAQAVSAATPTSPAPALAPNSTPKPGETLLVEYSDFQCPSCALMYPWVEAIHNEFAGRIQFVFREFPLKTIHADSERAAWAAEAAGQQGKFWQMADLLFKNQAQWSSLPNPMPAFELYAKQLGLDMARFHADFDGFIVHSKVDEDVRLGYQDRVQHTPTVLLNGVEIHPKSYAEFRELVNQAIAKNRQ